MVVATAPSTDAGLIRAQAAIRLALRDQQLASADLRYVAAGSGCGSAPVAPALEPGTVFAVCVSREVSLPGVPTLLSGRGVTTVGRYVLHVDDYRTVAP